MSLEAIAVNEFGSAPSGDHIELPCRPKRLYDGARPTGQPKRPTNMINSAEINNVPRNAEVICSCADRACRRNSKKRIDPRNSYKVNQKTVPRRL